MKRFLTCALCFVSLPAIAVPLYYEQGGMCSGLYLSPGCNGTRVTHLNVTPSADTTFTGFKVNGYTIVDANGNVAANASEILRNAGNVGSKIPQSYDCKGALQKNDYGFCVDKSGNTAYIDFESGNEDDGYEISYNEVGGRGGDQTGCQYYSKFKVKIHWCPPKYGAYPGYGGKEGWDPDHNIPRTFNYPELWPEDCESANDSLSEELYYEWSRPSGVARYCKNDYGCTSEPNLIKKRYVPSGMFNHWTLRGFYLNTSGKGFTNDLGAPGYYDEFGTWKPCPAGYYQSNPTPECHSYWGNRNYFASRSVVTETNTEGMARLGLPKPNSNTETGYIDLDDSDNGANGPWSNTRWAIWSCKPISEDDTIHLYARWARNCVQPNDGTCNLAIKRTGLYQNNNKGDAFYTATCNDGTTPSGAGTYMPQCNQPKQINYTYSKYMDINGNSVSCANGPSGGSCSVPNNFTLATPTNLNCQGGNYKFYRWLTNDNVMHEAGTSSQCTIAVLGGTTANITGILCDCSYTHTASSSCYSVCPTSGGDTCTFGGRCTVTACTNMGGVCTNSNGTECTCNQPSSDEPEWVSVEFRYGNVTLTSPASPTTFCLDKKRKCRYAYTQPAPKDNCGLDSPYRLKNITTPTAQGKTFAGFWRESQSLRIIDADGNVRAINQGIDQLTFNSSATATVMYLTAHWN